MKLSVISWDILWIEQGVILRIVVQYYKKNASAKDL